MHSLHSFEVSVLQIHYITICIAAMAGTGVVLGAVRGPAPAVRAGEVLPPPGHGRRPLHLQHEIHETQSKEWCLYPSKLSYDFTSKFAF